MDGSLKRMKSDYIDLLYQHRVDPEVPMEDVAGTVKELIQRGKVRYFGLSEATGSIRVPTRCSQSPHFKANIRYRRDPENGIIPTLEELGIALVPYSPLGKGFLAGKIDASTTFDASDYRNAIPVSLQTLARQTSTGRSHPVCRGPAWGDPGTGCSCLAPRSETLDRPIVRYAHARPPG